MNLNKFPKDLAAAVHDQLTRKKIVPPDIEVLIELFESMYFASLKTEESQPIVFHIVYLDPNKPDPDPPQIIVGDRWNYVPLNESIPATIPNLIKIAKASDPRTSSLAIYPKDDGKLFIWGLIDQGNRYHDFVNYDSESGPERPGIFQASIAGIGHLITYMGLWKIAELKANSLTKNALDVFSGGPVRETLNTGIISYIEEVKQEITDVIYNQRDHWDQSLSRYWISSLCRLLLRIQNYRHGGAILITPDDSFDGLDIKYRIDYERLKRALKTRAIATINETFASDEIHANYLPTEEDHEYYPDTNEIPINLYLDEVVNKYHKSESRSELDGTIWFISLLSRVDGLILMTPNLEVKGFGVEIKYSEPPPTVYYAENRGGTEKGLVEANYNHYGTRHRSMMRYCNQVPNSIGFVISQDGDVRIISKISGKLIIWDNIKLQNHFYFAQKVKRRRRKMT